MDTVPGEALTGSLEAGLSEMPTVARSQRRADSPPAERPERDLEAEMAEARRREWKPPPQLVEIVEEEAGVSRAEAVEALREHEGDIVAALQSLAS